MRVDLHVWIHDGSEGVERRLGVIESKLDQVLVGLKAVQAEEGEMSQELDALTAQVAQNTTVEESAVQLLNNLAAQIESLKNDPAALQALANSLKTSGDDLAAAITANTPAAPTS